MNIPFSTEQFFEVSAQYNTAIWPAQVLAYVFGACAVIYACQNNKRYSRIIIGILAIFWLWNGVFYHVIYFSAINPIARLFGVMFVFQGLVYLWAGIRPVRTTFRFRYHWIPIIGALFILYATIIYPLIGIFVGHNYPWMPMFGVSPCPTVIFTFGLFLWAETPVPGFMWSMAFLWLIIGGSAAFLLPVPQDYGLIFAGSFGALLLYINNRRHRVQKISDTARDVLSSRFV